MQTLLVKRSETAPRIRYRCPSCVEKHDGFPAIGYGRPDVIFALSREERDRRAVISSDLCILDDERFFVRGVLTVPVVRQAAGLEYGPWVEVSSLDFCRYAVHFSGGGHSACPAFWGALANALPGSEQSTLSVACRIVPSDDPNSRPSVQVVDKTHQLHVEQTNGISLTRAMQIVSHMKGFMMLID